MIQKIVSASALTGVLLHLVIYVINHLLRAGGFWAVDADTSLVELRLVDFLFVAFNILAWCLIAVYFIGTFMKHKIASILALFGVFMILMNSLLSSLLYPLLNVNNYWDIIYSLPGILGCLLYYLINNCSGVIQLIALGFITLSFIFTIKERKLPSLLALAGMSLKMFISISFLVMMFIHTCALCDYRPFGGAVLAHLEVYSSLYSDIVVYLDPLSWLLLAVYFVSCLFPNKKEAAK